MELLKRLELQGFVVTLTYLPPARRMHFNRQGYASMRQAPAEYTVTIANPAEHGHASRKVGASYARAAAAYEDACQAVVESAVLQAAIAGERWRA